MSWRCGRARCHECQPQAVAGGAGAEQPPLSQGRRRAAQTSGRLPWCHPLGLCGQQLSGAGGEAWPSEHSDTAIEHTRNVLCGSIYLGTVSNYSRSGLIFAILMV